MRSLLFAFILGLALIHFLHSSEAQIQWTTLFFDDFDRPNGPLGINYTSIFHQPPPSILNGMACGNSQNAALVVQQYDQLSKGFYIRVSFSFQTNASNDFEGYALAQTTSNETVVAGCDGGFSNSSAPSWCTPSVHIILHGNSTSSKMVRTQLGVAYFFQAIFYRDSITFTLFDFSAAQLGTVSMANTKFSPFPQFLGFVLGRNDFSYACLDDFRLEMGS